MTRTGDFTKESFAAVVVFAESFPLPGRERERINAADDAGFPGGVSGPGGACEPLAPAVLAEPPLCAQRTQRFEHRREDFFGAYCGVPYVIRASRSGRRLFPG